MADTVVFQSDTLATPPTATVIASDDCGASGQAQICKLAVSNNGSATLIPADSTDGLLVNLGANNDVTITGSVTANAGTNLNTSALALEATLSSLNGKVTAVNTGAVVIASGTTAVTNAGTFAVQAAQSGSWTVTGAGGTFPVTGTFWQATQPVSIAATVTTKETRSATGTASTVASSATSVTLLASNGNRLGATIYNDSTQILYVKFGATASASSFAVAMAAASYYEVPFGYTGIIDGIWASANGNARVTELT